jgi:hypothetical protein
MNYREIFETELAKNDSLSLHKELVRLRSEGVDREILMSELMAYHDTLELEADQDFILDILDCFYGWCSPDLRID